MMLIYILEAEHDIVPGIQVRAFRNQEDCERVQAEMRKEFGDDVKFEVFTCELE